MAQYRFATRVLLRFSIPLHAEKVGNIFTLNEVRLYFIPWQPPAAERFCFHSWQPGIAGFKPILGSPAWQFEIALFSLKRV